MKIKVQELDYEEALLRMDHSHHNPVRPWLAFRFLLKLVSMPDLKATHFECQRIGMEKLQKGEP